MDTQSLTSEHELGGCSFSLMRKGTGSTTLVLHGASGAPAWLPYMELLSKNHNVLVPEHPGFGKSSTPDWLDNIHDYAYYYLDFIEKFDLDNVHLVGISLGGWIAAELAVRNSSRLASLTLVGSPGIFDAKIPRVDTFLRNSDEMLQDIYFDQDKARAAIEGMAKAGNEDAFLKNRMAAARVMWHPRGYDPDLHKWLHRIDVPTLLCWGAQDRLYPPAYADAFAKLIDGARIEIIDQCGHLPNVEKPDEFAKILLSHLVAAEVAP